MTYLIVNYFIYLIVIFINSIISVLHNITIGKHRKAMSAIAYTWLKKDQYSYLMIK